MCVVSSERFRFPSTISHLDATSCPNIMQREEENGQAFYSEQFDAVDLIQVSVKWNKRFSFALDVLSALCVLH